MYKIFWFLQVLSFTIYLILLAPNTSLRGEISEKMKPVKACFEF